MAGAVHRLHAKALSLHLHREHVVFICVIVTRSLPQLQVEDVGRDWWHPDHDTFVPMEVFCTNSSFVRVTRNGSRQCKCHGHPLEPELPGQEDPLRYADGTRMATRVRAADFLRNLHAKIEAIFEGSTDGVPDAAPREYLVYLGYNDADYTLMEPKNDKETEALKLSLIHI